MGKRAGSPPDAIRMAVRQALRPSLRRGLPSLMFAAALSCHPMAQAQSLFPPQIDLATLRANAGGDGRVGTVLLGENHRDRAGFAVGGGADVNGDGLDDFLVGAPHFETNHRSDRGRTYVVYGRTAELGAEVSLGMVAGNTNSGFVIDGEFSADYAGTRVAGIRDFNGDGIDDVALTAFGAGTYQSDAFTGAAYVVFGARSRETPVFELETLVPFHGGDGTEGIVLTGGSFDYVGVSLAGPDINGDGLADVATGDASQHGYVVFGTQTGLGGEFFLSRLNPGQGGDGSQGFFTRNDYLRWPGNAASGAGDINHDGIDDMMFCSAGQDIGELERAGRCAVIFGRLDGFPAEFDLASLDPGNGGDGSTGFLIESGVAGNLTGRSAYMGGDVNNDGIDDILLGASQFEDGLASEVYIVLGRASGFPARFDLTRLRPENGGDGTEGTVVLGAETNDLAGSSVSIIADINGDGIDDIAIGALLGSPDGTGETGATYVVFGRATGFSALFELSALQVENGGDGHSGFVIVGENADDRAGTVSGAGDVNGDGVNDMLIGAYYANQSEDNRSGLAYLIYGRQDGDGDLIADRLDNCLAITNADQLDTDADGFGNRCDGDFNNDCRVDFLDLVRFRDAFGTAGALAEDMNGDETVDEADFALLRSRFFQPPGPGTGNCE